MTFGSSVLKKQIHAERLVYKVINLPTRSSAALSNAKCKNVRQRCGGAHEVTLEGVQGLVVHGTGYRQGSLMNSQPDFAAVSFPH